MAKVKALYGFSPELEPFRSLRPGQMVNLLRHWGADAVFGGHQDEGFVAAAHGAGLPVYAEFGCFVRQQWWETHPDSRPLTAEGEPLPVVEWYAGVTPSIPAVREGLLEQLGRLVREHDVDGVWLDFIRWPSRWESPQPRLYQTSFDPISLRLFSQETGLDLPEREPQAAAALILARHAAAWTAWKCRQITSWVAQARQVVAAQARRPCLLGLFGVPWPRDEREGAITRIMGQDFAALGAHVDVFSPMVYHRMCGRPVSWIAEIADHVGQLSGKPVWPIIQTMSQPDALSDDEFAQAMDAALEAPGSSGVVLYNLKGAVDEGRLDAIRQRFARP